VKEFKAANPDLTPYRFLYLLTCITTGNVHADTRSMLRAFQSIAITGVIIVLDKNCVDQQRVSRVLIAAWHQVHAWQSFLTQIQTLIHS
jgi:hypothetical protein